MSEQNKKEFQTPYEEYRVKAGYTRESASEELNGMVLCQEKGLIK